MPESVDINQSENLVNRQTTPPETTGTINSLQKVVTGTETPSITQVMEDNIENLTLPPNLKRSMEGGDMIERMGAYSANADQLGSEPSSFGKHHGPIQFCCRSGFYKCAAPL